MLSSLNMPCLVIVSIIALMFKAIFFIVFSLFVRNINSVFLFFSSELVM